MTLDEVSVVPPKANEIVVRIEASPVNPSDLLLLVGPIALDTLESETHNGLPALCAQVPANVLSAMAHRIGQVQSGGLEAAGTVIAAGADAQCLMNREVALWTGGMFAQYRTVAMNDCVVLPEGTTASEAASNHTNPMTALAMVETIRRQGHWAFVLTAAASNLGRMLNLVAQADGLEVVNIVRGETQAQRLRAIGARHVLNSSEEQFRDELIDAVEQTGARVAFDPIGGGAMAGQILQAMETAARRRGPADPLYGTPVHKHVYISGGLDRSPVMLDRMPYGQAWSVGAFYLGNALVDLGESTTAAMRARVVRELKTTFASAYAATIGLEQLLDPATFRNAMAMSTGGKFLLDPWLGPDTQPR